MKKDFFKEFLILCFIIRESVVSWFKVYVLKFVLL